MLELNLKKTYSSSIHPGNIISRIHMLTASVLYIQNRYYKYIHSISFIYIEQILQMSRQLGITPLPFFTTLSLPFCSPRHVNFRIIKQLFFTLVQRCNWQNSHPFSDQSQKPSDHCGFFPSFRYSHILFNYFIFLDTIICFIKFQNFQLYIGNIRNKFFPFTTSVKNFLCLSFLPIHPIVNAMLNSVKCVYCITLKFHMKLLSINCLNNLFNLRLLGSWECTEHNLLKIFKPFFKSFLPLNI